MMALQKKARDLSEAGDRESNTGQECSVWARNISAAYNGEPPVLSDINLELPIGELIAIVGPNGAGKSTLFSLLTGIKRPLTGELKVFGRSVDYQRERNTIAYVPQQEEIDWEYPIQVWDVVMGGRYGYMRASGGIRRFLPSHWAGKKHIDAVEEALHAVDMYDYRERAIGALSGGQKKRVFLARALAQDARLLLLDEPLVGVDRGSEELILDVLRSLRDRKRTIIIVTHDHNSAQSCADRMVLLNRTVIATGDPERILKQVDDQQLKLTESLLSQMRPEVSSQGSGVSVDQGAGLL